MTEKLNQAESRKVYLLVPAIFIFYLVGSLLFEGSYGGGDGIRHYLISRWSWVHPDQLLYSWGKPFFTLISSPFSQFGLEGIKVYNALVATMTALLCYLVGRKLEISNSVLILLFSTAAPMYISCVNSGLTEPSFAFFLIGSVWLVFQNRYIGSAMLISFLPFVRSEGNLMLPLFALIFILRGQWKCVPLLAFGTVIYSVVGYFYYHDLFWIKTQNPYTGQNFDIYGSGELLRFVKGLNEILGYPLIIIFVLGLIWSFSQLHHFSSLRVLKSGRLAEELILILGSFLVYFIAHSIFWWKGLFGSLGLLRSIAAVTPLAGIIALRGMNMVNDRLSSKISSTASTVLVAVVTIAVLLAPFLSGSWPMKLDQEEQLIRDAGLWYRNSEFKNEKVYYLYPYFMQVTGKDPFDGKKVGELWGFNPAIDEWGIDGPVPLNSIVMWDAHFGANEARIPLEQLKQDPNFELVRSFVPEVPFQTLGGYNFEIHAFKRVRPKSDPAKGLYYFDFEKNEGVLNIGTITEGGAFSGYHRCSMSPEMEYSAGFMIKSTEILKKEPFAVVHLRFRIFSETSVNDVLAVCSVDDEKGSLQWDGFSFPYPKNKVWQEVNMDFQIRPESIKENASVRFYLWNRGRSSFLLDDMSLRFN